jgi:uncharacterized protein with GYD domain
MRVSETLKSERNASASGEKRLKEMGGEIKAFYLTTGTFDMLAIVDVPNDAVLAAHPLWLGSHGNP